MTNAGDPRNDRPSADDLDAPPPRCSFCGERVGEDARQTCDGCSILCLCEGERVPLTHVPVDGSGPSCDQCAGEIRQEQLIEEAWGRAEAKPMGTVEALKWAVDMALDANRVLNGGGAHPDDEDEDETREIPAETMDELVNGKAGRAA
jgi:hypothetical protein